MIPIAFYSSTKPLYYLYICTRLGSSTQHDCSTIPEGLTLARRDGKDLQAIKAVILKEADRISAENTMSNEEKNNYMHVYSRGAWAGYGMKIYFNRMSMYTCP